MSRTGQSYPERRAPGQSLAEYALLGTLVALAGLGVLVLLGQTIRGEFNNISGGNNNVAVVASNTPPGSDVPAPVLSPPTAPVVPAGMVGIAMPDGSVLMLQGYNPDVINSISTAGANGTTEMLASTMDQIIQQLLAEGKITPTQSNLLLQLANQGHDLAALEGQLKLGGVDMNYFSAGTPISKVDAINQTLSQVMADSALEPSTQALVSQLTGEIVAISQSVYDTCFYTTDWGTTAFDLAQLTASTELQDRTASALTNTKSSIICETGGNADSGTLCTVQ